MARIYDDPEPQTDKGECPYCGNDLLREGGCYAVFWVPTKLVGRATKDGHIVLMKGITAAQAMWDWDSDDGPDKKAFACSECGRPIDLVERWVG